MQNVGVVVACFLHVKFLLIGMSVFVNLGRLRWPCCQPSQNKASYTTAILLADIKIHEQNKNII